VAEEEEDLAAAVRPVPGRCNRNRFRVSVFRFRDWNYLLLTPDT